MENSSFGTRLRDYAIERCGSIGAFAKLIGVHQASLSRNLNDKNDPSKELLIKLANIGCNINWLLTGKSIIAVHEPGEQYGASASQEIDNPRVKELEEENETLRSRIAAISELSNSIQELKNKQHYGVKKGG